MPYMLLVLSRDSSVGIATDYRPEDQMIRIRFSGWGGLGIFPFHTKSRPALGSTASYPVATRGSVPGGKAAGA
jgi:hypothetical protein